MIGIKIVIFTATLSLFIFFSNKGLETLIENNKKINPIIDFFLIMVIILGSFIIAYFIKNAGFSLGSIFGIFIASTASLVRVCLKTS